LLNTVIVPGIAQSIDVSEETQQATVDQITDTWYELSYGFCALCLIMSLVNVVQGRPKKGKRRGII